MRAFVNPSAYGGPFWTPITPKTGSLFHADQHYRITIVLTDNGTHFTTPGAGGSAAPLIVEALAKGEPVWAHAFEYACAQFGVEHRLTKPKHPWTNGQVERMNRTIKDASVSKADVARLHEDLVAATCYLPPATCSCG